MSYTHLSIHELDELMTETLVLIKEYEEKKQELMTELLERMAEETTKDLPHLSYRTRTTYVAHEQLLTEEQKQQSMKFDHTLAAKLWLNENPAAFEAKVSQWYQLKPQR